MELDKNSSATRQFSERDLVFPVILWEPNSAIKFKKLSLYGKIGRNSLEEFRKSVQKKKIKVVDSSGKVYTVVETHFADRQSFLDRLVGLRTLSDILELQSSLDLPEFKDVVLGIARSRSRNNSASYVFQDTTQNLKTATTFREAIEAFPAAY